MTARLPQTPSKSGTVLDRAAVAEAIELLGIEHHVEIRFVASKWTGGTHRTKPVVEDGPDGRPVVTYKHALTLRTTASADRTSRSLWHELTDAMQCEKYPKPSDFDWAYANETRYQGGGDPGYTNNRFEVEARAHESLSEDLRLTKITAHEQALAAIDAALALEAEEALR